LGNRRTIDPQGFTVGAVYTFKHFQSESQVTYAPYEFR
jgi:hypothetical protein